MASTPPTTALSMKLLIHTKAQRVLFAEAGKDVVDFLFSLLALPVGTAVRLLGTESMVGSAGHLYASVVKLDGVYIQDGVAKDALLQPTVFSAAVGNKSSLLGLPPPPSPQPPQPKKFYRCNKQCNSAGFRNSGGLGSSRAFGNSGGSGFGGSCAFGNSGGSGFGNSSLFCTSDGVGNPSGTCSSCRGYITARSGTACPSCNCEMSAELTLVPSAEFGGQAPAILGGKGFVEGIVTYTVMDDLAVTPMSSISIITLLNTFAVKDLAALQERTVQLGYDEGLAILRASLQSKTVLTDVFLAKKPPSDD